MGALVFKEGHDVNDIFAQPSAARRDREKHQRAKQRGTTNQMYVARDKSCKARQLCLSSLWAFAHLPGRTDLPLCVSASSTISSMQSSLIHLRPSRSSRPQLLFCSPCPPDFSQHQTSSPEYSNWPQA